MKTLLIAHIPWHSQALLEDYRIEASPWVDEKQSNVTER